MEGKDSCFEARGREGGDCLWHEWPVLPSQAHRKLHGSALLVSFSQHLSAAVGELLPSQMKQQTSQASLLLVPPNHHNLILILTLTLARHPPSQHLPHHHLTIIPRPSLILHLHSNPQLKHSLILSLTLIPHPTKLPSQALLAATQKMQLLATPNSSEPTSEGFAAIVPPRCVLSGHHDDI